MLILPFSAFFVLTLLAYFVIKIYLKNIPVKLFLYIIYCDMFNFIIKLIKCGRLLSL